MVLAQSRCADASLLFYVPSFGTINLLFTSLLPRHVRRRQILPLADHGGWFFLLLWPAISFGLVASAYLGLGPRVFGKRPDGTLSVISIATLLPYFLYLWAVWHVVRLASREPPYNSLPGGVLIGRRLLSRELPSEANVIVDLTCEFSEPQGVRDTGRYISIYPKGYGTKLALYPGRHHKPAFRGLWDQYL